MANRKKQKFIKLFILAACPANGDGDGGDTVKSNFLVMIFYAAFGNTLTALRRQAKDFLTLRLNSKYIPRSLLATGVPRIEMIPKSTPK